MSLLRLEEANSSFIFLILVLWLHFNIEHGISSKMKEHHSTFYVIILKYNQLLNLPSKVVKMI